MVALLLSLRKDVRRALRPTVGDRISRVQLQAEANQKLLETQQGRVALVSFFVSEANVSGFFREAEERLSEVEDDMQLKELLEKFRHEDKPWYSLDRLKKGAKAIGGKLFDKANDLIKPYLGGKSEEDHDA